LIFILIYFELHDTENQQLARSVPPLTFLNTNNDAFNIMASDSMKDIHIPHNTSIQWRTSNFSTV